MTPQQRAEKSAETMLANDPASRGLGMTLDEIAPGRAVMSMVVRDDMVNGHAIAHGGFIFLLADSAFAFACNSYNRVTVAQQNQITFASPGQKGERLVAEAVETHRAGRSGTYDVTVRGADGRVVALMRGLSRTIPGETFPEAD
jgi:acyl-CoA thioesterase